MTNWYSVIVQGRVGLQINNFYDDLGVWFQLLVFQTTSWLEDQTGTGRTSWKVVPGSAACRLYKREFNKVV